MAQHLEQLDGAAGATKPGDGFRLIFKFRTHPRGDDERQAVLGDIREAVLGSFPVTDVVIREKVGCWIVDVQMILATWAFAQIASFFAKKVLDKAWQSVLSSNAQPPLLVSQSAANYELAADARLANLMMGDEAMKTMVTMQKVFAERYEPLGFDSLTLVTPVGDLARGVLRVQRLPSGRLDGMALLFKNEAELISFLETIR